ncbi:MAG: hypothetical protein LAN36_11490 [Acidobacteriia bacterium]|nr:hypothetical protein [Terriglobia bacterium]
MSNSITIQQTLNWLTAFITQRPTTGVGGNANEPALTSANYVMQTIVAPPFRWEWNRINATSAITTVVGQSDYPISLSDYGWLEKATLVNPNPVGTTPPNFELEIFSVLAKDGERNRPQKIAVLLDDNAGNITFRLFPVPDDVYTVDLAYQKAPIKAAGLNTSWAPIPDKLAFLYERGMLAQMQMTYNQQLGLSNLEIFFRQLVGAADGLSEMERAIFLEDALRPIRMRQTELQTATRRK